MFLYAGSFGLKINWMVKKALFKEPFGSTLRKIGGIPLDYRKKINLRKLWLLYSKEVVWYIGHPDIGYSSLFAVLEIWFLSYSEVGQYYNIPRLFEKRGGLGIASYTKGDLNAGMQEMRDFLAPFKGRFPSFSGPKKTLRRARFQDFYKKSPALYGLCQVFKAKKFGFGYCITNHQFFGNPTDKTIILHTKLI